MRSCDMKESYELGFSTCQKIISAVVLVLSASVAGGLLADLISKIPKEKSFLEFLLEDPFAPINFSGVIFLLLVFFVTLVSRLRRQSLRDTILNDFALRVFDVETISGAFLFLLIFSMVFGSVAFAIRLENVILEVPREMIFSTIAIIAVNSMCLGIIAIAGGILLLPILRAVFLGIKEIGLLVFYVLLLHIVFLVLCVRGSRKKNNPPN